MLAHLACCWPPRAQRTQKNSRSFVPSAFCAVGKPSAVSPSLAELDAAQLGGEGALDRIRKTWYDKNGNTFFHREAADVSFVTENDPETKRFQKKRPAHAANRRAPGIDTTGA